MFTCLSVDGQKWCFYLFALTNNAAMNVCVQLSLVCSYIYFKFSDIYLGVAGSWSDSIFNFWRNHQTVSQINSPVQIKSCLFSCFPQLSVTPSLQYIWQCFQLFACRFISLTRSQILKNKGYCILIWCHIHFDILTLLVVKWKQATGTDR